MQEYTGVYFGAIGGAGAILVNVFKHVRSLLLMI